MVNYYIDHPCSTTGQNIDLQDTKARMDFFRLSTRGSLWFSNANNSTGEATSSMASCLTVREPTLAQIIFIRVHLREMGRGGG